MKKILPLSLLAVCLSIVPILSQAAETKKLLVDDQSQIQSLDGDQDAALSGDDNSSDSDNSGDMTNNGDDNS